uniref:Uncharacterized protein n=1 Tax=Plectus sambesii TaxID=2011161 RepID=A0A914UPF9_9BILA
MYGLQKSGGHPNVLRLAGAITTIPNEFYVITEYCNLGSLAQFLQEKNSEGLFENELIFEENEQDPESRKQTWKSVQDWAWKDGFHSRRENKQITTSDLLWFALQIARAMHFLTEKKIYTHGVALRNVLLKSDFTLKVAEFGLSHSLCETDDDCQMMKDNMASSVRYMAPEMLATLECTTSSECWSFGIALWELFMFAAHEPYSKEIENAASDGSLWSRIESFLKAGGRLVIPNTIPENLKHLITDLWYEDSIKRPSFQTCEKILRKELMHSCPRILESEQMITTPTPSMYGLYNDNLEKLNDKELKIPCRISWFKVFLLIVLLSSAFFTVYMASLRPLKISPNPEIYTASNNENYQFLFQWNITDEELAEMTEKGRASNVYGNDFIRNWTPQYAAISGSRAHIDLLLYYSGDDQVWIVKAIFEARNTTSAVNFLFSINSDRWMSRGESITTSNFMPNNFDRSLFLDGIVNMRIYWSIVSSADSDLEYGKIVLQFLDNPALSTCCPRGWYLISKSNTCARVETQKMTWFNANRSCTQQGGRLASIRNDTDNQFLLTLMTIFIKTNDTNVWVGGRTNIAVSGNSKNWFWTDGSDFTTYENWADGKSST